MLELLILLGVVGLAIIGWDFTRWRTKQKQLVSIGLVQTSALPSWVAAQRGRYAFVSYSSRDQSRAAAIVGDIEQRGLKCWIAPRDIPPGSDYHGAIVAAIENCGAVILLFSNSAQESDDVKREVSVAQQLKKRVVPIRFDDTVANGSFQYTLSNLHWIDLRGGATIPLPLW